MCYLILILCCCFFQYEHISDLALTANFCRNITFSLQVIILCRNLSLCQPHKVIIRQSLFYILFKPAFLPASILYDILFMVVRSFTNRGVLSVIIILEVCNVSSSYFYQTVSNYLKFKAKGWRGLVAGPFTHPTSLY